MHLVDQTRQSRKIENRFSHTTALRSNTALPSISKHRQQLAADRYTANAHLHQQLIPLLARREPAADCSADNPLRALLRFSTAARDFCPSYLLRNEPLPTYISQYNSAEVSSACACFELSIACCTTTTGTQHPSANTLVTMSTRSQNAPAPRSGQDRPSSQTAPSSQLSPDAGRQDWTASVPEEYYYTPDTSDATITASWRGPSAVPDPLAFGPLISLLTVSESTSTHYETFTLINVALTITAIPHAHITGSVAATARTNPYALIDGGDTPSPVAVAASVRRQPSVLNILSGQQERPGVMPGVS
ncbi:MAG: hypothetical protein Q9210_000346 [Variospora velana]